MASFLVSDADENVAREIIRVERVSKTFYQTRVLSEVSLSVQAGEIHALVGHNGSGKSTLVKILSGFHEPDPGAKAWLRGEEQELSAITGGPSGAGSKLRFVHQDLGLILEMTTRENLALAPGLSRSPRTSDVIGKSEVVTQISDIFDAEIDWNLPLSALSSVDRTRVAIYRAIRDWDSPGNLLVLDEPTAALPLSDAGSLYRVIQKMASAGAGILLITHRLEEVLAYADRISVLRDGYLVATLRRREASMRKLVGLMLGDEWVATSRPDRGARLRGDSALEVRGLGGQTLRNVTFQLHSGEILGVFGLPDSGIVELPRLLTDRRRQAVSGEMRIATGRWMDVRSAIAQGVIMLPPDRQEEGIIEEMTVSENLTLSLLHELRGWKGIHREREASLANEWARRLNIRGGGLNEPAAALSGGNQQKVLLARCLSTNPAVLVLCEPTIGVDIGGRERIYRMLSNEAANGRALLVVSSDMDDLVSMCDRVIVLRRGRIVAEHRYPELSAEQLSLSAASSIEEA